MTEADILASTYTHKCDVIRRVEIKAGGWDKYEDLTICADLACAVSFSSMPTGGETDTVQRIDYIASLFVRPEIDIQPGDRIKAVIEGQDYDFLANEPRRYPSHNQVPLIRGDLA